MGRVIGINKRRFVIGLVILFLSVIILNSYLGIFAEKRIEEILSYELNRSDLGLDISYDSLTVNPVLAQVSSTNLKVFDERSGLSLRIKNLKSNFSYGDIVKVIKNNKFNEIEKLALSFDDFELREVNDRSRLLLEDFTLHFKGNLFFEEFIENPRLILEDDQSFRVSFNNLDIDIPDFYYNFLVSPELEDKVKKVDSFNLDLKYDATAKELALNRFNLSAPLFSLDLSNRWDYQGESFDNITLLSYIGESIFEFDGTDFYLGDSELSGKYNLDKLYLRSKVEGEFSEVSDLFEIPQGESELLLKGFRANFSGDLRKELSYNPLILITGIDLDNLGIDELRLNYEYQDTIIKLTSGFIESDLFTADIKGELSGYSIYNEDLSDLYIDNLEFRLKRLNNQLSSILALIEFQSGQPLPRDEGDIIIRLEGSLAEPKFIDLPF